MSALMIAAQWFVACLLGAAAAWALVLFFLRRRLGPLSLPRGPLCLALFLALFLVAFAAANLSIESHAFAMQYPLLAAPAQALFLILFYLYPDPRYAGRGIRWLGVIYAFAQVSAYIPQRQQATNPVVALHLGAPGVAEMLIVLDSTLGLAPIVVGVVPQIYARARQLAESGRGQRVTRRTGIIAFITAALVSYALLAVACGLARTTPAASLALQAATLGFFLLTSLAPVSVGFGLMSGRLYDREALLHRALKGVTLVICLLIVYAAGIVAFDLVFPGYAGLGYAYLPFILIITVLLAAIYPPLRTQVAAQIGRRFFRETYEAGQVLAAACALLRAAAPPFDQLCARLVTSVETALGPATVALWAPTAAGKFGLPTAPLLTPPLDGDARLPEGTGAAPTTESTISADSADSADSTTVRLRCVASGSGSTPSAVAPLILRGDDAGARLLRPARAVDVDRLPQASTAAGVLRAAGMRLLVPLVSEGELEGLLALAPRSGARAYGEGDDIRELLIALAAEAAPALRSARIAQRADMETRERERVEHELRTARQIQESLLPKTAPALVGWQITTAYQPAREVGGDFYDFITLVDGRLGIVIGDVTDKGIPAALVMATTRSMLRAIATQQAITPDRVLAQVNELLCPDLPSSMFVTCFYATLDPASGRMQYANAGQDLPYLRHPDGAVCELRATGRPLGLLPGSVYDTHEATLAMGDSLLFYSDGIVEAHNPTREMFGLPRIARLLGERRDGAPPTLFLLRELANFTGADWEQEDDITLVALRRTHDGGTTTMRRDPDESVGAQTPNGNHDGGDADEWRTLAAFAVPSAPGGEREAIARVRATVAPLGLAQQKLERLQTAVGEAVMNAMEHGHHFQAELEVQIDVRASPHTLSVRVTDQGSHTTLSPLPTQAPDLAAKLAEEQRPRGWGVFLMRGLLDDVRISGDESHHTVELLLALDTPPAPSSSAR